jgi:predicted acetyltransferase
MSITLKPELQPATIADYPIIQNMASYYVYDRTGSMGWPCSENGTFECIDFKHYFENPNEKAFLVKINNELAGFALLDKTCLIAPVDWNMGEFFILRKFQGKGVAAQVALDIFAQHPGRWSVAVMPENIQAVNFWRKVINQVSGGHFTEVDDLRTLENPDPYAMNILSFNT